MLAWQYTRQGFPSQTLERCEKEIPTAGKDEIVIKVKAVSVNPVDYKFAVFPDWIRTPLGIPKHGTAPHVPGVDFAGIVHEIGEERQDWSKGDQVFGRLNSLAGKGTLQEYVVLPKDSIIVRKPANVPWAQLAALPNTYTTVHGALINIAKLPFDSPSALQGRSVLILGGTGGTGTQAIQLAKKMGLDVVVTCSKESEGLVKKLGADQILDYKSETVFDEAMRSKYSPFTVILDCVGGTEWIPYMDRLLDESRDGVLPIYISLAGDIQNTNNITLPQAVTGVAKQVMRALRGSLNPYVPSWIPLRSWLANKPYFFYAETPSQKSLDTAPQFLKAVGEVVIDEVFPFDKAKEAFARVESGRAKGKVIIEMGV